MCEGQECVCCWGSAKPKCLLNCGLKICFKHNTGFPHHRKFWASPVAALGAVPAFLECRETSVFQFIYQTYCVKELGFFFFVQEPDLMSAAGLLLVLKRNLLMRYIVSFKKACFITLMNNQNAASPGQAEVIVVWLHDHGMKTQLVKMEIFPCLLQSLGFWAGLLM